MTALSMKGDRDRCLAAGMDAYVGKPIKREELIEVIERLGEKGKGIRDWGLEKGKHPATEGL